MRAVASSFRPRCHVAAVPPRSRVRPRTLPVADTRGLDFGRFRLGATVDVVMNRAQASRHGSARSRPVSEDVDPGTTRHQARGRASARSARTRAQVPGAGQGSRKPATHHRHRLHPRPARGVRRRLLLARLPGPPRLPRTNSEWWQWKVDLNRSRDASTRTPSWRPPGGRSCGSGSTSDPRGGCRPSLPRLPSSAGEVEQHVVGPALTVVRWRRSPLRRCASGISSACREHVLQNTKNAAPTFTPLPICLYEGASFWVDRRPTTSRRRSA